MADAPESGWLDPSEGHLAAAATRRRKLLDRVNDLDNHISVEVDRLRGEIDAYTQAGGRPARVYVHASPKLPAETNIAIRELVGRALQGMGDEAGSRLLGMGFSVRFVHGNVFVEPLDD